MILKLSNGSNYNAVSFFQTNNYKETDNKFWASTSVQIITDKTTDELLEEFTPGEKYTLTIETVDGRSALILSDQKLDSINYSVDDANSSIRLIFRNINENLLEDESKTE